MRGVVNTLAHEQVTSTTVSFSPPLRFLLFSAYTEIPHSLTIPKTLTIMGLRTSLERSSIDRTLPHNRPSKVDDWNNHNNDASREIGAAPHLSMGVDVWRNSSHASRPVAPPPSLNTQSDNPFDDPQYQIFSPFRRGGTIDMPTN